MKTEVAVPGSLSLTVLNTVSEDVKQHLKQKTGCQSSGVE